MKKLIVCLAAFALVAGISSVTFGRTVEEEKQAIRNYIEVLDTRIAKAQKIKDYAHENRLFAIKQAQLARLAKLDPTAIVAPAPAPTAEIIKVYSSAEADAGRGVKVYANGGYDAGLIGFAVNLGYDIFGKPNDGLALRIGANYLAGNNPNGNDLVKVASAKVGAIVYVTPYLPSVGIPLTYYVGGAYLMPFKVYGGRTGKWGVEAYFGANYDVPEMGIVNFELGYSGLKYAADQPALKGLDAKIGYGFNF